jgi:hypothetical protein
VKRTHVLAVSLLLAVAVVAGGFAAFKTVGLGSTSPAAAAGSAGTVAAKDAELDRLEESIQTALERRPPSLPPLAQREQPQDSGGGEVVYVSAPANGASASVGEDDDDHFEAEDESEHEGGEDD